METLVPVKKNPLLHTKRQRESKLAESLHNMFPSFGEDKEGKQTISENSIAQQLLKRGVKCLFGLLRKFTR